MTNATSRSAKKPTLDNVYDSCVIVKWSIDYRWFHYICSETSNPETTIAERWIIHGLFELDQNIAE